MTTKHVLLVEVAPHSPVSVFVPLSSAAAESFLLPPPTTLVGALAYAYLRTQGSVKELEDGASAAARLLEKVDYAAAGVLNGYMVFRTVERVYQHPYLRSEHRREMGMAYTVAPRAAALYNRLLLLYITRDRDLARYAYGITRVGRKEGLVSVLNVVCEEVGKVVSPSTACSTTFYFPKSIADSLSGPHEVQRLPVLSRRNFEKQVRTIEDLDREEFVVPKPPALSKLSVTLNKEGAVLRVETSVGLVEVPVPRAAIEG